MKTAIRSFTPAALCAARELGEVHRLVYGMLPAGSTEIQEAE